MPNQADVYVVPSQSGWRVVLEGSAPASKEGAAMRDDYCSAAADGPGSRAIDRRTALVGAAGALFGVALQWPSRARAGAASLDSLLEVRFDPVLARRLQRALDHAVAGSRGRIPGAILHVERAGQGSWTGTAGLGRLRPDVAIRPG